MEMYGNLPTLMQVFWACAIAGSLFMVVQLVLSFIGIGDADAGADIDIDLDDAGGMDLFTVKNITNFFVGFGWGGVSFAGLIEVQWLLVAVAVVCGCLFVALFIVIFKQLMKLESNGAVGAADCVGKEADVYLRIPATRSGKGKIQVSLNGASREFNAVTDDTEAIPTGSTVRVVATAGEDTVVVTRREH